MAVVLCLEMKRTWFESMGNSQQMLQISFWDYSRWLRVSSSSWRFQVMSWEYIRINWRFFKEYWATQLSAHSDSTPFIHSSISASNFSFPTIRTSNKTFKKNKKSPQFILLKIQTFLEGKLKSFPLGFTTEKFSLIPRKQINLLFSPKCVDPPSKLAHKSVHRVTISIVASFPSHRKGKQTPKLPSIRCRFSSICQHVPPFI